MRAEYYIPLVTFFADTLQNIVENNDFKMKRSYYFEIIAAFHGFKSYAAMNLDGLMSQDRYIQKFLPNTHMVRERAEKLLIDNEDLIDLLIQALSDLHQDEMIPNISLAKRLARNIQHNCQLNRGGIFSGSAFLKDEDWELSGNIASSDEFIDFGYTYTHPAIQYIATTRSDPYFDNYIPINPDPILNIIAFLLPQEISRLLNEMTIE